jgi:general secretion pathway protein G
MSRQGIKDQRGFTLLEMVVVVIVISMVGYVALGYYQKLLVDTERTKVQHDVGVMRSAIGMQVAQSFVSGNMHALSQFVGGNPIFLLEKRPQNYLGVYPNDRSVELEKGHWFFAAQEGTLIYIVRNESYCDTVLHDPKRIKFKIDPITADKDDGETKIVGLTLKAITPYVWLTPWD